MVCMYHCLKNHYSSYHFIQNFYTIAGDDWIHAFNDAVPLQPSKVELEKITKNLTFDEVQSWIEDYNGIAGRFRFFEMRNRQSVFYQRVAKPLLSMRTSGSMDVERRVKPMKNDILCKTRNRLDCAKATMLYRCSENLRHSMHAKKILGKKITDSLLPPSTK